jgi:hypothetical protein
MPASHFVVIYVNPILQDCKQALILLALISVFLFSVIATVGQARNFAVHC